MARVIWGLDFGDWSLKAARGTYDRKTGTITVDLLDEIVYGQLPCGYEASPLEKHRAGIVAFRQKYQMGGGDDLCVALTGSEVFHRFIPVPPVPGRLDDIMRYEAGQQIPFELDDVVWDFQPVKAEDEREEGEEIEVGLFAIKKERVAELMDLLGPWQTNLRVVQDAPLAAYNLLEYEGLVSEPLVVLDVGGGTTDVIVLNPPRFWVRTLLVAGDDLTNALVEQFGVKAEEAERIKRRAGQSAHKEQILRILQPVFDDLTNEIQRSLGYYKSLDRQVRFERVLTLGSALKMTGLPQMLAAALQYQVQPLRQLQRIQVAESVGQEKLQSALAGSCAALGLLVQGAGEGRLHINMVPEEVALAGVVEQKKPWALAGAVGVLIAVALMILGQVLYAQELQTAEQQVPLGILDQATQMENEYTAAQAEVTNLRQRLETLATPGVDRGIFLRVLPVFTDVIHGKEVYLSDLDFVWMEASAVAVGVVPLATGGGRRPGAGTAMYGPMSIPRGMGGPTGLPPGAQVTGQRGVRPTAPSAGARGRRATAAARGATGEAAPSAGQQLVMRFACESRKIGLTFIEEEVFEALRKAQFPEDQEPAFAQVEMIGDVRDVWRDPVNGQDLAQPMDDSVRFAVFQGYAIVNTGSGAEQQE